MTSMARRIGMAVMVMGAVAGAAAPARAVIVFNFEGQPATSPPPNGALTSLALTQDGLTLTLTREAGGRFDISNNPALGPFPASYGTRSLDPFFAGSTGAILGTFSAPVAAVSIDMGDFGQDADALLLQAFSGPGGTGSLLATATGSLPGVGSAFTGTTLSVAAAGIASIRFIGGVPDAPNSVFFDNITVPEPTAVIPEPSTLALGGMGAFLALGYAWRRRRAA